MFGTIVSVTSTLAGTETTADVAASGTVIPVVSVAALDDTGGTLTVRDDGRTLTYTATDADAGTVTLSAGLAADLLAGALLDVSPTVTTVTAAVVLDAVAAGEDSEGGPALAVVPHYLRPLLADGVRGDTATAERVRLVRQGWTLYVSDVLGLTAPKLADLELGVAARSSVYYQETEPVELADIGDLWFRTSDNAIFQWDGVAWTQRLIPADQILAAGSIVAESGIIASLDAGVINSGAIVADLTLSGSIKTAVDGARVEMDANGVAIFDADDNLKTTLSPGGSVFRGDVEATNLEVTGAAQFPSATNEIPAGGVLTLGAGVSNPATAPSMVSYWDSIRLTKEGGATFTALAVCAYTGGEWLSLEANAASISGYYLRRHDAAGAQLSRHIPSATGMGALYKTSMVYVASGSGAGLYMLAAGSHAYTYSGTPDSRQWYWKWGYSTGVEAVAVSASQRCEDVTDLNGIDGVPMVATDGTYLVIAGNDTSEDRMRFCRVAQFSGTYSPGELVDTTTNPTVAVGSGVCKAAACTAGDLGSTHFIWAASGGSVFRVTKDSDDSNQANSEWAQASSTTLAVGYDSSWWSADASGRIYRHNGATWSASGPTRAYQAAYSWTDSDTTGGVHETLIGPKVTATLKKRAKVRVTTAAIPGGTGTDDIDSTRIYVGVSGGTLYLQGGYNTTATKYLSSLATSGTTPPGASNFPAGSPAKIQSADGSLSMAGDGKFHWTTRHENGYAPVVSGAQTSSVTTAYEYFPAVAQTTVITVSAQLSGTISSDGDWRLYLGYDTTDPTSGSTANPANSLQMGHFPGPNAAGKSSVQLSAVFVVAANTDIWLRTLAYRVAGTLTIDDAYGANILAYQTPR